MDIFTHLMIGATATAPFWTTHPLESVAFVFGSILPDIDAMSRQFGKVAYLRAHQTLTHAIPLQLALAVATATALHFSNLTILVPSVAAVAAGAVLHSLLDWTNTYGVKLFAPFDMRRRSLEWVFFIDAFVIALTAVTLGAQAWWFVRTGDAMLAPTVAWAVSIVAYFAAKASLRHRAGRLVERAVSLIPSALWPWRFHALVLDERAATTFTVDALRGSTSEPHSTPTYPPGHASDLPEYLVMQELSAGFVATEVEHGRVVLRDLRTRNFGTNFGRLIVDVSTGTPVVEQFDV